VVRHHLELRAVNGSHAVRHRERPAPAAVAVVAALALIAVGCGRSTAGPAPSKTSAPPSAAASTSSVGDFGALRAICGSGNATGATGRGVTDNSIRIGVTADPGAAADPGLEQEFFDAGVAFTKWCNAAGGINGRKIILDKWDAKLFNVASVVIKACQQDFMLVGNGNAFDSAGVKQRLACKLGQMPAYVVSPEAISAGLQVLALPESPTQVQAAQYRLLAEAYPATKSEGWGLMSSTLSSLLTLGKEVQQSLKNLGIKVTILQDQPPLVDNYRPYMEQLKSLGSAGVVTLAGTDALPQIQAMNDIGFSPQFFLVNSGYYNAQTVKEANNASFPPTYLQLQHVPFELSDQFPVMAEIKSRLGAAVSHPRLTEFTALAFNAWMLWAQSATKCGSNLTQNCVLSKAVQTNWTAGGMLPPMTTSATATAASPCSLLIRLTTSGWVYDKKVTQPDHGIFNCNPENLISVRASTRQ
jgi:Periplasmic binding protein